MYIGMKISKKRLIERNRVEHDMKEVNKFEQVMEVIFFFSESAFS